MNTLIDSIEILLVEDNPDDIFLIKTALEENNFVNKITYLKDGEEALDYIYRTGQFVQLQDHHQPKIIMLDLHLPKVSGIDILRRLKSNSDTQDIPIVVFTTSKDDPNLRECYRLGVKNYIVKPSDFTEFKRVIDKTISGLLLYVSMFGSASKE